MLHWSKKASVLSWITFNCLPCIKQLVEDFASKIAKILKKLKKLPKAFGLFYALLNFNCESAGHNFALFSHLKGTLMTVYYFDGNRFKGLYVAASKMNAIMLTSSEIQKLWIYHRQKQNCVKVAQGCVSAQKEV